MGGCNNIESQTYDFIVSTLALRGTSGCGVLTIFVVLNYALICKEHLEELERRFG